jgi:prepilin-type N-terminal cleavage/methylation domain-containing protein
LCYTKGNMSGGTQPFGYTIVEVMIVLAITGVLFLTAISFVNGKQATTSFHSGVAEFAAQIQDTIEQVSDGQYSDVPFVCTVNGSGTPTFPNTAPTITVPTSGSGTDQNQGTNDQCTFVGKLVHLGVGSDSSKYETFSLAGASGITTNGSTTNLNGTVNTLSQEQPQAVYQPGVIDLTTQSAVPEALTIKTVSIIDSAGGPTHYSGFGAFGFVQGIAAASNSGGGYQSGTQTVSMVDLPVTQGATAQEADVAGDLAPINPGSPSVATPLRVASTVSICLTDGTRYAEINLGFGNDSQLQVQTDYHFGDSSC